MGKMLQHRFRTCPNRNAAGGPDHGRLHHRSA